MDDKTALGITAMICLTMLEGCAVMNGKDGAFFSLIVGSIMSIATGLSVHAITKRKYTKQVFPANIKKKVKEIKAQVDQVE